MNKQKSKPLKIYFKYVKKYRISLILSLISIPIASLSDVVVPLYYKKFFDELVGNGDIAKLTGFLFNVVFIYCIGWIFWRIGSFLVSYLESRVMADLSNKSFKSIHKHSIDFFNNNFVGSLVKKVNKFVHSFEGVMDLAMYEFLPLITTFIAAEIVLFRKNIYMALIVVVWLIIYSTINILFSFYKLKHDIKRTKKDSEITGLLADTITNQISVKLFNANNRENLAFEEKNMELHKLRIFSWNLGNVAEAIHGGLIITLEVGLFFIALKLWQKNILTIGDIVLIQAYVLNIFMRIWRLGRMIRRYYEYISDSKEMIEIFETPYAITDLKDAKELIIHGPKIEFKNVYFNYNQTRNVIHDFNLTIQAKEKIAIIGPSGAGKSTIVNLLLRNYDVERGSIFIDNQKITKVTQDSLWKNISFVPQDTILFHRTLMENIRYGNELAKDEEVIEASKLAFCHDFIETLQDKYDTYVGERGIKLSGGERQRIAIARAILKNSPILVLDEATSSLDSQSEELIQKALTSLMVGKTVIVIAHRLSTIMKMDRIIVMGNGKIIEQGSHNELLLKNGLYKRLWNKQVGGFIA